MEIDTRNLGEKVFITVLDDWDKDWEVVEGEIGGIIATVEKTRTWIQYKIDALNAGWHQISENNVYLDRSEAEKRCQLLNKVKSS